MFLPGDDAMLVHKIKGLMSLRGEDRQILSQKLCDVVYHDHSLGALIGKLSAILGSQKTAS
jgi:hypothetical protein